MTDSSDWPGGPDQRIIRPSESVFAVNGGLGALGDTSISVTAILPAGRPATVSSTWHVIGSFVVIVSECSRCAEMLASLRGVLPRVSSLDNVEYEPCIRRG